MNCVFLMIFFLIDRLSSCVKWKISVYIRDPFVNLYVDSFSLSIEWEVFYWTESFTYESQTSVRICSFWLSSDSVESVLQQPVTTVTAFILQLYIFIFRFTFRNNNNNRMFKNHLYSLLQLCSQQFWPVFDQHCLRCKPCYSDVFPLLFVLSNHKQPTITNQTVSD